MDTIELATRVPLPPSSSSLSEESTHATSRLNESSLPPIDKGFGAWSFLTAAFLIESIVWGFPNAYGVFLDAYLSDPQYTSQNNSSTLLPLIGPASSGIIYCSAPFITSLMARYPYHRRTMMRVGAVLAWASLFSASYTNNVALLVLLQGVLYAIGGSLLYYPCISYLSEWFLHRRGFANGVVFAGTGAGGILLPLILPRLISAYGPAKTLRGLSVAVGGLVGPLVMVVKGRLPETGRARGPVRVRGTRRREWMKDTGFLVLLGANTIQGFGYFVPVVWLPTFASALNLSSNTSSIVLALFNCGSVLGRLSLGYLSDKLNPWSLAVTTLLSTSIATFVLWGVLSYNLAGLLGFGITYGVFAGGWSSMWTGFVKPLTSHDPTLSTTLFGYLLFLRGIGNILSTPISSFLSGLSSTSTSSSSVPSISSNSTLLQMHNTEHLGFHVGGGKFEKMIVYVGTCFAGAALTCAFGWGVEASKTRRRRRVQEN